MLIEFRVENHRSIRDEQVLTMEAGRVGDAEDPRPRKVPGHSQALLPAAALYGANASGKSNVLSALSFMRDAVLESHRRWGPEGGVPRDPFAWGPRASEPSFYEATILVDGVRYEYGFVADGQRFLEEWLHAWPSGHKQTWFERDADEFKFGANLRGENRTVQLVTRPNALFLAAAVQLRHEQLAPVYRWFYGCSILLPRSRHRVNETRLARIVEESVESSSSRYALDRIRELLGAADVGIVDLRLVDVGLEDPPGVHWKRLQLRHRGHDEEAWLALEQESDGTRALLSLTPRLFDVLDRGGLVAIDELEASLHPLLARRIVDQFNDPVRNPRNGQILFTTHDTNLIGTVAGASALRRDQIWLTEKDAEGATSLYPLTDYKPRASENLERGYLQGRYGAIPFLGELARVEGQ